MAGILDLALDRILFGGLAISSGSRYIWLFRGLRLFWCLEPLCRFHVPGSGFQLGMGSGCDHPLVPIPWRLGKFDHPPCALIVGDQVVASNIKLPPSSRDSGGCFWEFIGVRS